MAIDPVGSDYRKFILKLARIDDFQKVHGFISGLEPNYYHSEVKQNEPKSLKRQLNMLKSLITLSAKLIILLVHIGQLLQLGVICLGA